VELPHAVAVAMLSGQPVPCPIRVDIAHGGEILRSGHMGLINAVGKGAQPAGYRLMSLPRAGPGPHVPTPTVDRFVAPDPGGGGLWRLQLRVETAAAAVQRRPRPAAVDEGPTGAWLLQAPPAAASIKQEAAEAPEAAARATPKGKGRPPRGRVEAPGGKARADAGAPLGAGDAAQLWAQQLGLQRWALCSSQFAPLHRSAVVIPADAASQLGLDRAGTAPARFYHQGKQLAGSATVRLEAQRAQQQQDPQQPEPQQQQPEPQQQQQQQPNKGSGSPSPEYLVTGCGAALLGLPVPADGQLKLAAAGLAADGALELLVDSSDGSQLWPRADEGQQAVPGRAAAAAAAADASGGPVLPSEEELAAWAKEMGLKRWAAGWVRRGL
jgi:hypothetical protein